MLGEEYTLEYLPLFDEGAGRGVSPICGPAQLRRMGDPGRA